MFSLWSMLNSPLSSKNLIKEKLEKSLQNLKLPITSFYKTKDDKTKGNLINKIKETQLKQIEKDLIKKFSDYLNIDDDISADTYLSFIESSLNPLINSSDLMDKLTFEGFFDSSFLLLVEYYYRERYTFLKIKILILSSITENTPYNYNQQNILPYDNLNLIKQLFKQDDMIYLYKSCMKDYINYCKEIKIVSSKKTHESNIENFNERCLTQLIKEFELNLELILILSNIIEITKDIFNELVKEFKNNSIINYLTNVLGTHSNEMVECIQQITYLQTLIVIKATKLDKLIMENNANYFTLEEKTELLKPDTKILITDLINSYGSNPKASPICLAWSTLLYNLTLDPSLNKLITNEIKNLTNRLFGMSIKENVFSYLLDLFASSYFSNMEVLWHIKQIIYDFLNSVLHSFDESSMGDNLKTLFELCFFCMDKNELICENFWKACNLPDRENLTILMSHSIEKFPISLGLFFTFLSLVSKTSPYLCYQTIEFLNNMDQYCEYLDNLNPDEFTSIDDSIKLLKNHKLFDSLVVPAGQKGFFLGGYISSSNQKQNSNRMILKSTAISWKINFNCFELILCYLNRINYAAEQNALQDDINNITTIIGLIDSLLINFFNMEEQDPIATSYMEKYVNSCFCLFTHLMNHQSKDSIRLISKLIELFNNIAPQIYDKLIRLLEQNNLIGFNQAFNKMTLEQIFNNRFHLMNSCTKQLFIFKSHDYELIINYLKLIDNLIKESGNSIQYLSPICCVLLTIFPHIHKWKSQTFNFNLEISSTCLTLLHSALNAQSNSLNHFPDGPIRNQFNFCIDQFCEQVLINTECSESLLGLINSSYMFSQDLNYLNEIKRLDNILIQSVSLINRLIFVPYSPSTTVLDKSSLNINHSQLYINLIKSINIQSQNNSFQAITSLTDDKSEYSEIIKNNNKFLLQLNLMMNKSNTSQKKILDFDVEVNEYSSGINWFHLLTKIAIYKSNQILDCLLFSIFKKLSQLTPRLFGSLLGPYTNQFHKIILDKLNISSDGQILKIISEFLCSSIENQPGFFQTLANIKVEKKQEASTSVDTKTDKLEVSEKFIEGEKSVLKSLFDLLAQIKSQSKWNDRNSNITIAGIYSIFFTLWFNKKTDYVNYCKQKDEFWPILSSTLQIIKKECKNLYKVINNNVTQSSISTIPTEPNTNDETLSDYLEYFGFDNSEYENQFNKFNEFVLEANIKSVSYAFKIFSLEIFESFIFEKPVTKRFAEILADNIFKKNLIEKWLDFYFFQLKKDLINEKRELMSKFEFYDLEQQNTIKPDMSIIDPNVNRNKAKHTDEAVKKFLKSKLLFDSIKTFLLLLNKINRIASANSSIQKLTTTTHSTTTLTKLINMKNIELDNVFSILIDSIKIIINHLFNLNNILVRVKREQEQLLETLDWSSNTFNKSQTTNNFFKQTNSVEHNYIKLRESNEIVKQFHSLSSTLMVLITSIKDLTKTNLSNAKTLIYGLIEIFENLTLDEFNYFPSIIDSIMVSIFHFLTLNDNQNVNCNIIDMFNSNEIQLKKFVQTLCKIFTISVKNLEQNSNSMNVGAEENFNIFILNIKLLKFVMSKFDNKYWYNDLVECCAIQFMYALFEKYIQNDQNSYMVYAILELFYTFSQTQCDHLMKSNFNTNTCLLSSRLFEYAFPAKEIVEKKMKLSNLPINTTITWSNVLCLYVDIQTILLTKLKYKYLNDSILFFGSYYEAMIQIITKLNYAIEPSLLKVVQSVARFFTQISMFKKELIIGMSSYINLELCITKISNIKGLISKSQHHHHAISGKEDSFQAKSSRIDLEEMLLCQNLLFSILSFSMDAIYYYIPNLANPLTNLEEYNLLLAVNLNTPSAFDIQSSLSFGSLLWMIDYCMKILQKYESNVLASASDNLNTTSSGLKNILSQNYLNKTTSESNKGKKIQDLSTHEGLSPRKNVTILDDPTLESKQPAKNLVNSIMEKLFNFLFTQIILFDLQNQFSARDRKIFKREITLELNSVISGFQKTQKKSASSTQSQYTSKSPVLPTNSNSISNTNINANNANNLVASEFSKLFHNLLMKELNV